MTSGDITQYKKQYLLMPDFYLVYLQHCSIGILVCKCSEWRPVGFHNHFVELQDSLVPQLPLITLEVEFFNKYMYINQ